MKLILAKSAPVVQKIPRTFTGAVMGQYGAVLGFVGLAFSAADCFAESLRGAPLRRYPSCSADARNSSVTA